MPPLPRAEQQGRLDPRRGIGAKPRLATGVVAMGADNGLRRQDVVMPTDPAAQTLAAMIQRLATLQ